jgi:hypothetical protein
MTNGMDLIAFVAAQPTPNTSDAGREVNTAGWGTFLWIAVIAVVFFVLITAAALGLATRRRTRVSERQPPS